ncbi:MAG: quinolinate synthase NadA [Spirochaetales bacterium]|nr:MAG: quinolinate synthase NadA [Spirochaetales bacterium]
MYDTSHDITDRIKKLKKDMNAVILAHSYQRAEIQDLADFVGDSLGLCIEASKTDAETIVFCGVHFMAESAKLLNPEKLVLLPEKFAGCPLANMVSPQRLRKLKDEHPDAAVITYINSTAAVKAETDICCTSSNAVKVVNSVPEGREILFVPDKNLGRWVMEKTGRDMILWQGYCPTHHLVIPEHIEEMKKKHPGALVLVHPECSKEVADTADFVGSTEQIVKYCTGSPARSFIIGTEEGILHRLKKFNPDKEFYLASEIMVCANMKLITLESVLRSMERKETVIELSPELMEKAKRPIERMLAL